MTRRNKDIGDWGESIAASYIEKQGFTVLERNFRTPYGELDIIAQNGEVLVIVEVKTRTSTKFGHPESAITEAKMAHMQSAVEFYLTTLPCMPGEIRLDVISISAKPGTIEYDVEWFENVTG
ncbi:MAG TPA: YraN family protein [Bellilinea sp.]|nr:YraN family protein [Bellilinea sp.]